MQQAEKLPVPAAAGRRVTLAVLALASFAVFYNNLIVGPLLVELSQDLHVSIGQAGQLVAAYALPAAAVALLAGPLLDRYGRRRVLLVGVGLVALGTGGCTLAADFPTMVGFRLLAGIGGASVWPATLAAAGDLFPYRERASAIGWIQSTNTLAPTLGVPIGTLVAQALGWRAAFGVVAVLLLGTELAILTKLPSAAPEPPRPGSYVAGYREVLGHRGAVAMIAFGLLSHVFWHGFLTYAGTFYQTVYGLSVGQLGPIFAGAGCAIILGNVFGGRAASRYGSKPVALVALLAVVAMMCAQLALPLPFLAAIGLHLLWSVPNGARGPGASNLLVEVLPGRRGTVVCLNSAASSLGTLVGASAGGAVVGSALGFPGLAALCGAFGLAAAGTLWLLVTERHSDSQDVQDQAG